MLKSSEDIDLYLENVNISGKIIIIHIYFICIKITT